MFLFLAEAAAESDSTTAIILQVIITLGVILTATIGLVTANLNKQHQSKMVVDHDEVKNALSGIRADIRDVKSDITDVKSDVRGVKGDVLELRTEARDNRTKLEELARGNQTKLEGLERERIQ